MCRNSSRPHSTQAARSFCTATTVAPGSFGPRFAHTSSSADATGLTTIQREASTGKGILRKAVRRELSVAHSLRGAGRGLWMLYRARFAVPAGRLPIRQEGPHDLVTGRGPATVPHRREGLGGTRTVRHSVLCVRPHHTRGRSAACAGFRGAVRLHAALRGEGQSKPGHPECAPRPWTACRRL